ncbi:hypothetical protein MTO96_032459, partial [Rhipicephalus appendiculatus]
SLKAVTSRTEDHKQVLPPVCFMLVKEIARGRRVIGTSTGSTVYVLKVTNPTVELALITSELVKNAEINVT